VCGALSTLARQVRCYEVQASGVSVARASFAHDAPVLAAAWHHDGGSVFSAGCDKQAKRWDLGSNSQVQVAAHDAPIRHMAWVPDLSLLVTGGWDRLLRYWDLRSPSPAHTHTLPERCYALSVAYPLLVAATAERHIQVFNLAANPGAVYKQLQSPLKYQTRCVAAFPDKTGFLVGSIEGRVAVQHVEEQLASKNFTFKCHRNNDVIHAVNACVFHPVHGTFVTTGSDGGYNFWDKDSKQRLKQMQACAAPIPAGAFSADGSIFAYAVSYDWSKGAEAHAPATATNAIYLHSTQEAECKPRARTPGAVGGKR
jgi:mRNA export factor